MSRFCPCCGQVIAVKQDERHKRKREYARAYRKRPKARAYHREYMRKIRALNKTAAAVSEEGQ